MRFLAQGSEGVGGGSVSCFAREIDFAGIVSALRSGLGSALAQFHRVQQRFFRRALRLLENPNPLVAQGAFDWTCIMRNEDHLGFLRSRERRDLCWSHPVVCGALEGL